MKLGFYLLEHGEVLNDLLGESINSACEMCQGGEEAGRAVGGFRRLLHPMRSETAGEAARIVVGRPDSGATLPCRRPRACSGWHCSGGSSGLVAPFEGELPRTRSAQSRVGRLC